MNQRSREVQYIVNRYSREYVRRYRKADEASLARPEEIAIGDHLSKACLTFRAPDLKVLDIGCGTGRYFHYLRQVNELWGVDLSPYTLKEAKHPVRAEEIARHVKNIKLIYGDFLSTDFPLHYFDLVYSMGVLAEYIPLNEEVVSRIHDFLKTDGLFIFTAVTPEGRGDKYKSISRVIAERIYRYLPKMIKNRLHDRLFLARYYASRAQIEMLLSSHFEICTVNDCFENTFPHLICVARATSRRKVVDL